MTDLHALPTFTGQWFIAHPDTTPPAMTANHGQFVDPWPETWIPVGPPNLPAVVEYGAGTGHTLRFLNDPSVAWAAANIGAVFALGGDNPTTRQRIIFPKVTQDHMLGGLRLLRTDSTAFQLFVAAPHLPTDHGDVMAMCTRCGRQLHTDMWGRWVDPHLWATCGGDRPHKPTVRT
ncbi:hypothetical protein AB0B63_06825 [Micromonospora sp. NPDC049081]|uniref:hypothetical protein n=1 Tax=Micromonospora sp. NPDC049081 TaxID=3155150 RepID=UPI0033C6DF4D